MALQSKASGAQVGARQLKRPVAPHEVLRFGLDIDGTIGQAPHHFRRLIDALLATGNEVYIITARRENLRAETEALLASFGVTYTELVMMPNDWAQTVPDFKVATVCEKRVHLTIDDEQANCWAIEQHTEALAAHMLPIPEIAAS